MATRAHSPPSPSAATTIDPTPIDDLEALQLEIAQLNARLVTADREKAQAGELGLHLLNEKGQLEAQLDTLQREYESTRTELEKTKKVLAQFRAQHRVVTDTEMDHEQNLLEDSARLEAAYGERIASLEAEARALQQQVSQYKTEAEHLQGKYISSSERLTVLEGERKGMREELKELKAREQSLLSDNNELEEENITLQKQNATMKAAQIEYEAMKMEIARLLDETVLLQSATDEANKLRSLAEKQEQEALMAAQQEREQRIVLRKELEKLRNDEHLNSLNSLYLGIKDAQSEDDRNMVKQLESSFIGDGPIDGHQFGGGGKGSAAHPPSSSGSDLFSEIHGGLTEKVNELEAERGELVEKISDLQRSIVQLLMPLLLKLDINPGTHLDGCDPARLKEYIEMAMQRLEERVAPSQPTNNNNKEVELYPQMLRQAILLAGQKNAQLGFTQDKMIHMSSALHQFYLEIVGDEEANGDRQQVTQIMDGLRRIAEEHSEGDGSDEGAPAPGDERAEATKSPRPLPALNLSRHIVSERFLGELATRLATPTSGTNGRTPTDVLSSIRGSILNETDLRDTLVEADGDDFTSSAFESLLRLVRKAAENNLQTKTAMEDKDKEELYQTITKQKSLLAVKREQVASLRNVLRSNKTSTEGAIQCLRAKYESEKKLKDESMDALRQELKQFKEDAATFASHRAMFTARCEDLAGQLESAKESLRTAEEEKKTLNQLLRMAIQQKLAYMQRLEDVEMNRDIHTQHPQSTKRANPRNEQQQQAPQRQQSHRESTRAVRYPTATNGTGGGGGGQSTGRNKQ